MRRQPPLVYAQSMAPDRVHDGWLLSVVQEAGRPRPHVQSGAGMQANSAGLTFTVAGLEGSVTYVVEASRQVQVKGGSLRASADCVLREADGVSLRLYGNVRLHWERGGGSVEVMARGAGVNLQTGQVELDLDPPQAAPVQPRGTEATY